MSSSKLIVAVLGGPSPGIKEAWPSITSGHDTDPFPLAIQCFSQDQADRIMRLQNYTVKFIEGNSPSTIFATLAIFKEDITGFFPNHEEFFSIVHGWKVGIFLDRPMALAQVNGLEIQKFHKFKTLIEALHFMIFKGNIPNDESQLTSTGLTRDTKSFVTIHRSSTSQRQHGVPQPASLQQLATQFKQLQVKSPTSYQSIDSSSLPIVFHYNRSLSGITGIVFVGESDNINSDSPPAGVLGIDAEKYLFAYGYQASAIWSIIHAFREGHSSQDFTNYLCTRGMPLLEAKYLFELISGRDVYLCDSAFI
ncbi:uncharacterized protein F5147DRAFT_779220 [Suillus discolor]|uniref:Ribonuclease H1 N-terminal domain-containing protein n=1 Tax=Suillus discolor TaxID=1912936 RepID=A0A9P7EVK4_9AGAM|nr:uncharacterized protein F5147DRAFT_779220 [Suillus discolor]KAG2093706.1 hypothetical protein F5147DRAFT_779220 [Suillus discolor]